MFTAEQNSQKNLLIFPGLLLMFCSLVFPTTYQTLKLILLFVTFLVILMWYFSLSFIPLKKEIILFVFLVTTVSGFFIMLGAFNGEPGAYRVSTVYLLWPFVYLFMFSTLTYKSILLKLFKVFIYSLLIISIYSFTYIGHEIGILPSQFYIKFDLGQSIGFYSGFMEYSIYSLSSLIFLIPFCISGLFIWEDSFYKKIKLSKKTLIIITIFGLISALLSGRRALWLVVLLSTVITFILYLIIFNTNRLYLVKKIIIYVSTFILIFLIVFPIMTNKIDLNIASLLNKFNLEAGYERSSQFDSLIKGWAENPLLGNGHGAVADVIRSTDMPWAYELQYIDLLFKTGLLGFLIYSFSGLWVILKMVKIAKILPESRMIILPILTALISFLIANITNPYLLKFDYIWILILPIGIINLFSLSEKTLKEVNNV